MKLAGVLTKRSSEVVHVTEAELVEAGGIPKTMTPLPNVTALATPRLHRGDMLIRFDIVPPCITTLPESRGRRR